MLIVLTCVTAIAVGLLAYVNELTQEPINKANLDTLNASLKEVVPGFTNNPVLEADTVMLNIDGRDTQFIVYPAKDGEQKIGTAIVSAANGFSGEISVLVGFDNEGKIINYSVLNQSETPGLGTKIVDWFKPTVAKEKSFIERIFGFEVQAADRNSSVVGINPGETRLAVSQDGGSIDAITASTISSRAFLKAVNNAYAAYSGQTDGVTSATQQQQTDATSGATAKPANEENQVDELNTDGNTAATAQTDSTETN